MPRQTNQLPRAGKVKTPPPKRNNLLLLLGGGALLVIIIGVVLLATPDRGPFGSASPAQASGQPKLAVDRQQIDFGRVPLDAPVKAVFNLSNVGDRPLQILSQPVVEVKQGC